MAKQATSYGQSIAMGVALWAVAVPVFGMLFAGMAMQLLAGDPGAPPICVSRSLPILIPGIPILLGLLMTGFMWKREKKLNSNVPTAFLATVAVSMMFVIPILPILLVNNPFPYSPAGIERTQKVCERYGLHFEP